MAERALGFVGAVVAERAVGLFELVVEEHATTCDPARVVVGQGVVLGASRRVLFFGVNRRDGDDAGGARVLRNAVVAGAARDRERAERDEELKRRGNRIAEV